MLLLMAIDYTTLRVYKCTTFTCITTHSSITGVTGTSKSQIYVGLSYAVALGTETVPPYEEESVVGLGGAHGRFGGGNGPLTIDTWPHHQLICMRAQLFISNSSVSLSRQTFTNNFF